MGRFGHARSLRPERRLVAVSGLTFPDMACPRSPPVGQGRLGEGKGCCFDLVRKRGLDRNRGGVENDCIHAGAMTRRMTLERFEEFEEGVSEHFVHGSLVDERAARRGERRSGHDQVRPRPRTLRGGGGVPLKVDDIVRDRRATMLPRALVVSALLRGRSGGTALDAETFA